MGAVQALFTKGFAQIDQAKSIADEVGEGADVVEQIDSQPQQQQQQEKKKKKDKPTSLVQVATENKAESAASLYASAASAAKESELLN